MIRAVQLFVHEWPAARADWQTADPRLFAVTPGTPVDRIIEETATSFGALVRSIMHQQVSIYAGRAITTRLADACAGALEPAAIRALTEEQLRTVGLSRQKVQYVLSLAGAAEAGALEGLEDQSDDVVIERLVRLPGIGTWTAKMFCIFHLLRPDIFSGEDLGLREGIRILDGQDTQARPKDAEMRAEIWQPYRSVAAIVLWDLVRRTREEHRITRKSPISPPHRLTGQPSHGAE